MASTRCPECDTLREITPTDQPVGRTGTAKRWRVVLHVAPKLDLDGVEYVGICDGSGNLI